jgi:hypothetical protein
MADYNSLPIRTEEGPVVDINGDARISNWPLGTQLIGAIDPKHNM